ncbi:MAG: 50S ribosomal protein L23 [Planctomycetes bacterium]|nr:50S ribosomal protein L23 [Planctomycetota bacterium]MCC7508668.1 50S ribosomal protein L23 [Planctomycetota bacterium]
MSTKRELYGVLKRPMITEKSSVQMQNGTYVFEVELESNKYQIAQAVRDIFGVTVAKVRTVRMKGRKNQRNRFGYFDEKDWKKAMVTLKKGETIEIT